MDRETLSLVLDTIYENAYNDGYNDCKSKAKKYINELKENYKNGNGDNCGRSMETIKELRRAISN